MRPTRKFEGRRFAMERPGAEKTRCISKWSGRVGLFVLFSLCFFGCGVKGPPLPPKPPQLPAVVELAYQVAGQTVALTWRLPGPLSANQAKHAAFGLYRSRTPLAEPPCDSCPLVFEKVATVPYLHSESNRFSTDAPLTSGYRYVFKMRLETDRAAGPDSNLVRIDKLPDRPAGASETP